MICVKNSLCIGFLMLVNSFYVFSEIPQYVTVFAHGLGGDATQKKYYQPFIGCPIIGQNGPEWSIATYGTHVEPQKFCFAQEADIAVVIRQMEEQAEKTLILAGVSKGAATMLTTVGWLATHKPGALVNIKALILDSPFSNLETVPIHISRRFVRPSCGASVVERFESCMGCSISRSIIRMIETCAFPHYNPNGITPLKAVTQMWESVDKNMVIVFIHSRQDRIISINDSRRLYLELKRRGFVNVYLIEVEDGKHANVFRGPCQNYIFCTLCYIYQKHGLPLPPLAKKLYPTDPSHIQQELEIVQPSIKEVEYRLSP